MTMRKVIALLAIISTPAFSQGYIGIQLGESDIQDDINDGADITEDTDTSVKLFGGVSVNDLVSAEVGVVDFGSYYFHFPAYDEHQNYDASAFYGAAVFTPQITETVRLLGKAGLAYWDLDATVRSDSLGIYGTGSGSGLDPMFGVGVEFLPSPQFAIRAEYERYMNVGDGTSVNFPGYGSVTADGTDIDVFGVAATYSF